MVGIILSVTSVLFAVHFSSVLGAPLLSAENAIDRRFLPFSNQKITQIANTVDKREKDFESLERRSLFFPGVPVFNPVSVTIAANNLGKRGEPEHLFTREYDFELEDRDLDDLDVSQVERRGFIEVLKAIFGIKDPKDDKKSKVSKDKKDESPTSPRKKPTDQIDQTTVQRPTSQSESVLQSSKDVLASTPPTSQSEPEDVQPKLPRS